MSDIKTLGTLLPIGLIKTVWPPDDGLRPGAERFDALLVSVQNVGIQRPLVISLEWTVIDGHHRLAVAKYLGFRRVPVVVWDGARFR